MPKNEGALRGFRGHGNHPFQCSDIPHSYQVDEKDRKDSKAEVGHFRPGENRKDGPGKGSRRGSSEQSRHGDGSLGTEGEGSLGSGELEAVQEERAPKVQAPPSK